MHAIFLLSFQAFGTSISASNVMNKAIEEIQFFLCTVFSDSKESRGGHIGLKHKGTCKATGQLQQGGQRY